MSIELWELEEIIKKIQVRLETDRRFLQSVIGDLGQVESTLLKLKTKFELAGIEKGEKKKKRKKRR